MREATFSQNQHNRPKPRNNTSGYKGVSWNTRYQKWEAKIMHERKHIWLGWFDTAEEASQMYADAAHKYHKEFSCI
jgi:hypothetical protein